jgi:hypothetical protein
MFAPFSGADGRQKAIGKAQGSPESAATEIEESKKCAGR